MKVLEKGRWNNVWKKEVCCPDRDCGAKLLLEEEDLNPVNNENNFYAKCPVCNAMVYVAANDVPRRLRDELAPKRKYWSSGDPF